MMYVKTYFNICEQGCPPNRAYPPPPYRRFCIYFSSESHNRGHRGKNYTSVLIKTRSPLKNGFSFMRRRTGKNVNPQLVVLNGLNDAKESAYCVHERVTPQQKCRTAKNKSTTLLQSHNSFKTFLRRKREEKLYKDNAPEMKKWSRILRNWRIKEQIKLCCSYPHREKNGRSLDENIYSFLFEKQNFFFYIYVRIFFVLGSRRYEEKF